MCYWLLLTIYCFLSFFHVIQWESRILFWIFHVSMLFSIFMLWHPGQKEGRHWKDRWPDRQIPPVFYAAALVPLNLNHKLLQQGTGTADHIGLLLPFLT